MDLKEAKPKAGENRPEITRRAAMRRVAWAAPAVLTTVAVGARAAAASGGVDCDLNPFHPDCQ